ncbi:MAG: ATP-binding protein [Verrucomicrobiota bacterium]
MPESLAIIGAIVALLFGALWYRQLKKTRLSKNLLTESLSNQKQKLRANQARILNALNDSVLLVGNDGVIRFANDPAADLVAGRILENRNIKEVFLDDRLTSAIERSLDTGKGVSHQVVLPQQASPRGPAERRGETAWIIDAAPLDRNAPKTITRVVIRDITAEHQTEQIRKDFVANASHELRTPLAIINGYLENLVDEDIEDPALVRRSLLVMQKHGDRIAHIIEDMLVISRLESGEAAAINLSPFRYADCVQDVLDRLESVFREQGARAKVKLPNQDLILLGDRFYWTQILFNLVENALKQNPRLPLKVEIGATRLEAGGLHLWIADNGVGIPSADIPFIFRRFYRVEKHHNQREIKGTGLGLSIVKRAVEAHHGTIEVRSTPGQRTAFDIKLPASSLADPSNLPATKTTSEAKAS